MLRPEYNKLKQQIRKNKGLYIEDGINFFTVSLMDGGTIHSLVVVLKADDYEKAKEELGKIINLSKSISGERKEETVLQKHKKSKGGRK